jgi:hypothetical protein
MAGHRWASATCRSACFSAILTRRKTWQDALGLGKKNGPWEGARGAYGVVEFDDEQPRVCETPASYSGSLGARFGEEGRGKWRGACGVFIAAARHRLRQEIKHIEEGSNQRGNGLWRDWWPEVDDDLVLTRGSNQSAGERGGEVPVREQVLLGHGLVLVLGQNGAPGLFILFRFPFGFLYPDFLFLS